MALSLLPASAAAVEPGRRGKARHQDPNRAGAPRNSHTYSVEREAMGGMRSMCVRIGLSGACMHAYKNRVLQLARRGGLKEEEEKGPPLVGIARSASQRAVLVLRPPHFLPRFYRAWVTVAAAS